MEQLNTNPDLHREETLDPEELGETRELSYRMIDDAVAYLRDVRNRPVWRSMPDSVRSFFSMPAPAEAEPLADVYRQISENLMPYAKGNIHPRFWAWYMGSSNYTGAMGDFLAAIQGSNLGGGNHAGALMDRQVVEWFKQMIGFPASASGTLVSGGSMANIIGLNVARNAKAGVDVREHGVAAMEKALRFYGSDQIHSCHRKAVEVLGLGNQALRRIPSNADFRIDLQALKTAIAEDRAAGLRPACVIGTAGTVNTGAIDDLEALFDLAKEEDLWFHVDGCIGALIAIAPENAYRVAGIEKADSVALDPHKWLHTPFEAGCALVRDRSAHRGTFATTAEYMETSRRGMAAADLRLRPADLARFPSPEDVDVLEGARRRKIRSIDRSKHRAGSVPQFSYRNRAYSGACGANQHKHSLLSLHSSWRGSRGDQGDQHRNHAQTSRGRHSW